VLTSRQKLILKAIVEMYIKDGQPIGSKAIVDLPYLNFSSALIRAEMAHLEELDLLEKTHTSSGRVPSRKGYRYYVDKLVTRDLEVRDYFSRVDEIILDNRFKKDKAIEKAIDYISELTNLTAVSIGSSGENSLIKKIEYIQTTPNQAVVLIVTADGHVEHDTIIIPEDVSSNELKEAINSFDKILKDKDIKEASHILKLRYTAQNLRTLMEYEAKLLESFIQTFARFAQENVYLTGIHNVFGMDQFSDVNTLRQYVTELNDKNLIRLLSDDTSLSIRFGDEISFLPRSNCTIVSIPYKLESGERGNIALIGPTRINYKKVIPLLEYLAGRLSKL
jgi:heat-inducible transcriptional repressor